MTKEKITQAVIGLIIILLVGGFFFFSNNDTKDKIVKNDVLTAREIKTKAKSVIKDFLVKPETNIELGEVTEDGDLYKIDVKIDNQKQSPLYMTKNGNKLILQLLDIDKLKKEKEKQELASQVVKSDKPNVELFVMSYCPFGTQMEKGYLPAVEKLGDKINAEVKFVNYIMHNKKEADENVRQYCITKNERSKANSYLACFLEKGDAEDCLKKNKIDKNKLTQCITEANQKFSINKLVEDKKSWLNGRYPQFKIHDELNQKYGVKGSPTLVINGKVVQTGRDAKSVLKAICAAFNTPPAECSEDISSATPTPGFGYEETSASQTTASCGN